MPLLIRTPEQIFREEGKDIYIIRFLDDRGRESPAWQEIQEWLVTHLPSAKVEMLGPSEYSGWIEGYFGDLRVDFSESDLATFCTRWETPDGKSIDPRFQCYLWPYQLWHDNYGNFVPTNERPAKPGLTLWYDTPIGFIHHQISQEEAVLNQWDSHPGRPADIWVHAGHRWPELAVLKPGDLPAGSIQPLKPGSTNWFVTFENFACTQLSERRKAELLDWFCLPDTTPMVAPW